MRIPTQLRVFGLAFPLLVCAGCGTLDSDGLTAVASTASERAAAKPVLPPIPTAHDAVALDVFLIDRAADDELLGDMLWREIDESSAVPAATRAKLDRDGFRVGRTAAMPPRTLQVLMGLTREVGASGDAQSRIKARRVVVPSGGHTELDANRPNAVTAIDFQHEDGRRESLDNPRCLFRLRATRLQDGWARVELTPEVHHGAMTNRPVATRGGWTLRTAQKVERIHRDRVSLDLNLGEMVVLTRSSGADASLGEHFFGSLDDGEPRQHLLVLRLASLSSTAPLYAE